MRKQTNEELFGQPYDESDPHWVIKGFFDIMYQDGYFVKVIELMVKKWGFGGSDDGFVRFPDMDSYEEEDHFEGVEFGWGYMPKGNKIVLVSEEICVEYMKLACSKYLERHPEDKETITELLENSIVGVKG